MRNEVNEIKISYCESLGTIESDSIQTSEPVAKLLYENWNKDTIGLQETFKVLLLNNGNKVKGVYQVSSGGITGTLVDLRVLFAVILKSLSTTIILAHNHPAGTLAPSDADIQLTKKIQKAGKLFDIRILDHLIISPTGDYFSFMDNNII